MKPPTGGVVLMVLLMAAAASGQHQLSRYRDKFARKEASLEDDDEKPTFKLNDETEPIRADNDDRMGLDVLPADCGRKFLNVSHRIAGGYNAKEGEFPSYMRLRVYTDPNTFHICGGTLISERHVLTAAHCLAPKTSHVISSPTIYMNSWSHEENYRAATWCLSPQYDNNEQIHKMHHDLALITLEEPVEFDHKTQPACLPRRSITEKYQLHAVGLGNNLTTDDNAQYPEILQVLPVKLSPCHKYDRHPVKVCFMSSDSKYRGDTCGGDSGGPIYLMEGDRMVLAALTSYGAKNCKAGVQDKSVNTDVYATRQDIGRLLEECGQ